MSDWRQLSLLKGRRQKGERPTPPREDALHIAFGQTLKVSLMPGWRATYMPFGEYRTPKTAGLLKRKYVTPGWPDFMLVCGEGNLAGTFVFVELKRPGRGRVSVDQAIVHRHLEGAGAVVIVSDDVGEVVNSLRTMGAVRARAV